MAQFPVSDQQGVIDGLNYVLSGPVSLGQNFAGFSSSAPYDLTGNYRQPFTLVNTSTANPPLPLINLDVAPIALTTSEMLDGRTWKFTFASPQPAAPFINGQPITVSGVSADYDGTYSPIGVVECTTTYVIARTNSSYAIVASASGGTVGFGLGTTTTSTDCNGKVTVTNATDRVFISAQLNNQIWIDPGVQGSSVYRVALNRYIGTPNNDPVNPEYVFDLDATIAYKEYTLLNPQGTVLSLNPAWQPTVPVAGVYPVTEQINYITKQDFETIFTSIMDTPPKGYYWYILEIKFIPNGTPVTVTNCLLGLRSFTAQVVKA
jgi:hypothetical protein